MWIAVAAIVLAIGYVGQKILDKMDELDERRHGPPQWVKDIEDETQAQYPGADWDPL